MNITSATSADLGTLSALERACFDEPWTTSTLAAALSEGKYVILLARDERSTLAVSAFGYAIGWNVGEEAELARVGVHALMRGQGFGKKITDELLAAFRAREVKIVFLEVRITNIAALALYKKCGFAEVGQRPNYYADGETAIIMRADL